MVRAAGSGPDHWEVADDEDGEETHPPAVVIVDQRHLHALEQRCAPERRDLRHIRVVQEVRGPQVRSCRLVESPEQAGTGAGVGDGSE